MNFWINSMSQAQSRNLPEKAERNASVAGDDVGISRSFVFRVLRAKERRGGGRLWAKQQDGRAMATVDRQIPSLDTFLCEPWSSFVSAAKLRLVDSKFSCRWWRCFHGETVGKCVVQLPVIELSKPSPPCSVCFCHSAAKVSVKKPKPKYDHKYILTAVRAPGTPAVPAHSWQHQRAR